MKFSRLFFMAVVCFSAISAAADGSTLSPAEYRQQLDYFRERLLQVRQHAEKARDLQAAIPDHVSVRTASGEYTITYAWLKKDVTQFLRSQPEKRDVFLQQLGRQIERRRSEAQAFESTGTDGTASQQKLNEILSRREFRRVHGPTWFDIWLEKILRWLDKVLSNQRFNATRDDVLHIVVYIIVAVALAFFAIWLKRRLDHGRDLDLPREIIPFAPSARGWRSWLNEARSRAQQHDWRNAIHLAYWAGIANLEEHGAWRPDRARTPREYLRLLSNRSAQYSTLTDLTRKFEVTWYGDREASEADFQETLGQLERLGCR